MTDAEIKKALMCHCHPVCCVDCPMHNREHDNCVTELWALSLDLINRLEAEVTSYMSIAEKQQSISMERHFKIKRLKEECERQQAEIERLQNECFCIANERDAIKDCINTAVEEAKAEAIKEFAERLKAVGKQEGAYDYVSLWEIDKLLKEMAGDAE